MFLFFFCQRFGAYFILFLLFIIFCVSTLLQLTISISCITTCCFFVKWRNLKLFRTILRARPRDHRSILQENKHLTQREQQKAQKSQQKAQKLDRRELLALTSDSNKDSGEDEEVPIDMSRPSIEQLLALMMKQTIDEKKAKEKRRKLKEKRRKKEKQLEQFERERIEEKE